MGETARRGPAPPRTAPKRLRSPISKGANDTHPPFVETDRVCGRTEGCKKEGG